MHLAFWQTDLNMILAGCCLHNFFVEHNKSKYLSCQDTEDTDIQQFILGNGEKIPNCVEFKPHQQEILQQMQRNSGDI